MIRFLAGFLLGSAFGLAVACGSLVALGHYLAPEDPLERADAIIALSGDQGARVRTAVELWKQGFAPVIVFAGASLDVSSPPSAELMKREALRLGVPAERVLIEPYSQTTAENASRVVDMLAAHNIKTAILVTSPYHQRRASLLFGRELSGTDVRFRNYPARDDDWDRTLWWTREPSRSLTLVEVTKLGLEVVDGFRRDD